MLFERFQQLDQQHGISQKWQQHFNAQGYPHSQALAEEFIRECIPLFGPSTLLSRPVICGKTSVTKNSYIDCEVDRPANQHLWMLHFTIEGEAEIITDTQRYRVSTGDAVLFSPHSNCRFHRSKDSDIWVHYWAVFHPKPDWSEWLKWSAEQTPLQTLNITNKNSLEKIESSFAALVESNSGHSRLKSAYQLSGCDLNLM